MQKEVFGFLLSVFKRFVGLIGIGFVIFISAVMGYSMGILTPYLTIMQFIVSWGQFVILAMIFYAFLSILVRASIKRLFPRSLVSDQELERLALWMKLSVDRLSDDDKARFYKIYAGQFKK